jgi:hypothetical protein
MAKSSNSSQISIPVERKSVDGRTAPHYVVNNSNKYLKPSFDFARGDNRITFSRHLPRFYMTLEPTLNFVSLNKTDQHKATFGRADRLGGLNEPSLLETGSRAKETESIEPVDTG